MKLKIRMFCSEVVKIVFGINAAILCFLLLFIAGEAILRYIGTLKGSEAIIFYVSTIACIVYFAVEKPQEDDEIFHIKGFLVTDQSTTITTECPDISRSILKLINTRKQNDETFEPFQIVVQLNFENALGIQRKFEFHETIASAMDALKPSRYNFYYENLKDSDVKPIDKNELFTKIYNRNI